MARPRITAVSEMVFSDASSSSALDVPLPFHQKDDVIVLAAQIFPSPLGPVYPAAPAGWQATTASLYSGRDYFMNSAAVVIWWWRRATDSATPTPRIVPGTPAGFADLEHNMGAFAFVVRDCVTFGDPFESRTRSGGTQTDNTPTSPTASTNPDSLMIVLATATSSGLTTIGSPGQGFSFVARKVSFYNAGSTGIIFTRPVEAETVGASFLGFDYNDSNPSTFYNVFTFVAIPTASVGVGIIPATAVPIRGMARGSKNRPVLGCASEYEAIITGNDYETRIDAVRWSNITWERVLDEISTASVVVPDEWGGVACCAKYGGLKPWRYGMTIERDGMPVWKGPVTSVARSDGRITISCSDTFSRFRKRLATRTESLRFVSNDVGQMFAYILNVSARVPTDAFVFNVPQPAVGVAITRNVVAREFNYAWDVVEDLLDSSIDAYVLAGVPVVFQPNVGWLFIGPLNEQYYLNTEQAAAVTSGGDTVYGMFTQEAFTEIPQWTINGMAQANTGWAPGADSGQGGFRKFWTAQIDDDLPYDSVLDIVETAELYRAGEGEVEPDDSAFQRRVDSLVALRAIAPAVIDSVSLSAEAPVNVENLRPGSIWTMDVFDACWGQLLAAGRVKRVRGSVQAGEDEKIAVTLQPLGYTEGAL
ncbi:MAG: hypothetical protein K0R44_45 [Thermomicrobiales bacterium]|jgi:hypothetical protein|nr:hypothetical protein [Thermomicrobiales bacterium]MDF3014820.1 hypothetical protein [Thermomicrobiales bacterium]